MKKRKNIAYEEHPREYTVLGISVVCDALTSRRFKKFVGVGFSEIISVIRGGRYLYINPEGEWEMIGRAFLKRVENGKVDLTREWENYKEIIEKFEKLVGQKSEKYSLATIKQFHKCYRDLLGMICIGYATPDYIEDLSKENRASYKRWVGKVRLRGENVYKAGEIEFLPRYAEWLAGKYFPNYTAEELLYVFYQEMYDFIVRKNNLPSPKILRKRKKLMYLRQYPRGKYQLLTGGKAKKEIERKELLQPKRLSEEILELKGQIAHSGKAAGRAKIIFSRSDMKKFKKGDILVTPMTELGYLPAMKKAAAFVTDEGGVLCHAAIVSRELRKPCVIGTKIVTKVLKDGDRVQVDASEGIVKILKKR